MPEDLNIFGTEYLNTTGLVAKNLQSNDVIFTTGGGGSDVNKANASALAPVFSASLNYIAGSYVTHDGDLYKFITDHIAGAWNNNDVELMDLEDVLEEFIKYPVDTNGEIIYPLTEKMLTIKPNSTSNYEDIPEGNVVKNLLFNSFTDDESRTTVNITINTSGSPATGEVKGLRSTSTILHGPTIQGEDNGIINIIDEEYLKYGAFGISMILPVIAGHTYKIVPKTARQEDAWFSIHSGYFTPGFDFSFNEPYVQIPNTQGAIAFDPETHSDDGEGKLFNGSGFVVPSGMNYFIINIVNLARDTNREDGIREFDIYDYSVYPITATYDKIVEDPVVGDSYKVSYALTNVTSSNNTTTVGGSSQYSATITANTDKIISGCSVKVGNTIYTPTEGSIIVNNANSNIKITAEASALPDDSYVGSYEIKRQLIPSSLLAEKLDTPAGLAAATEGQILCANGHGGVKLENNVFDDLDAAKIDKPTGFANAAAGKLLYTNGSGGLTIDDAPALDAKISYPLDSEDDIILPVSEKMLTIKPNGSSDYADIPTGDVSKSLLLDSLSDDTSRTQVRITINTSGTPATGEVQGLRNTCTVLQGSNGVGMVNITTGDYLWYVANGKSLLVPVTPGHTYKIVPRTPKDEDRWYALSSTFFAPDFDATFNEIYVAIPNTEGSIEFDATTHSTEGTGKIFDGEGLIVPAGMHYMIMNAGMHVGDSSAEDGLRDFEIYDYTLYPTDATYDKIVDDPVIGDTYRVSYSLTRTTSSNNTTTINGSSQYVTTLTADQGKIISSCTVKIGQQTYRPVDGVLTIDGSNSNIKITAASEALPDNTYVGAYEIKRELIPESLLSAKLDAPAGLRTAPEGQMLYTNGSGGLVIARAPYIPDFQTAMDMEWTNVYSKWQAGYYYDPDNDLAYTQIPSSETTWEVTQTYISTSCTPYNDLIPVQVGEKYRYSNMPMHFDSKNAEVPSIIIFDANKTPITSYTRWYQDPDTIFTIPEGGAWMAVLYANSQTYKLQKYVVKTHFKEEILDNIRANYRSYLRGTPPVRRALDKPYFCIGSDDLRPHQTKKIHEAFSANNFPYYMASIPEAVKACIQDDPYKTNYDYMQLCLAGGGEIICHSDDWITTANVTDFDTLYKYFCLNKRELQSYGFDVRGIFKAGGDGAIGVADQRMDAWATYYYEYSDAFGYNFPYNFLSRGNLILEWATAGNIDNAIQRAFDNTSYACFALHELDSNASAMLDRILTDLSGYTRGVDYDFITPYELYQKLMPEP